MGKRGPKPKGKVKIKWSANFAYAIGLLTSDGCLSNDRRHISFVSKEKEQINNFLKCLDIKTKIGITYSGYKHKWAYRVQFGDVLFYKFLESIGLSQKKSKTIPALLIPDDLFADFLRGLFDGDGSSYSYWDTRWKSSFMFYVSFCSASKVFIYWIRESIKKFTGCTGHITRDGKGSTHQLKYSKYEAIKLSKFLYSNPCAVKLKRKYLKIMRSLGIVRKHKGRVFVRE